MIEQNSYKVDNITNFDMKQWEFRDSDTCLPEKIHCNVALSPRTDLGLFFQIAFSSSVSLDSAMKLPTSCRQVENMANLVNYLRLHVQEGYCANFE